MKFARDIRVGDVVNLWETHPVKISKVLGQRGVYFGLENHFFVFEAVGDDDLTREVLLPPDLPNKVIRQS